MKGYSRHTPEQIVVKLEQARRLRAEGLTFELAAREIGVSTSTLARWQNTYGAMSRSEARDLKRLRDENARLARLLGQAELEKAALRELIEKKF